MVLDRELTIQELLFNNPIEINKTVQFDTGGITADVMAGAKPISIMDLDAPQFHGNDIIIEKLGQHFVKNWGWYAGAAAIGLVVYYSTKPEKSKPKPNGYFMHNGFIPYPDVPVVPIKSM